MSTVPSIGFFQFDNLLKTRVPFLIVNLGVDLSAVFRGTDWDHIQIYQLNVVRQIEIKALESEFAAKKIPTHYPIVFVCDDGIVSKDLSERMDERGWLNCFYVYQGIRGLVSD
jgi:hypothetical protein